MKFPWLCAWDKWNLLVVFILCFSLFFFFLKD